ncbi:glycosyltransferase [Bandra megavirus]|uniref:Glycosyltransferase n=1 Tax=Bandra megavirus TaxID=2071566 RepID=A0A2K9V8E1_9VIRU|nr:glycosyltransferase [Bandra megavirus]
MLKLEDITLNNFIPNRFASIERYNNYIRMTSQYGSSTAMIAIKNIESVSEKYNINFMASCNAEIYWRGSYSPNGQILIKNGFNSFQIMLNKNNQPITIEIISNNLKGKYLEMYNFNVNKMHTINIPNTPINEVNALVDVRKFVKLETNQNTNFPNVIYRNKISDPTNISVILPTYNRFKGFVKVVNNFKAQKLTNFEFIAIDDGSDMATYNLKKSYIDNLKDPRFKIFANEKNMGISYTLNRGISLSSGEYVTWVSDDNEYYNNYLSVLYDTNYDFIYSSWILNRANNINQHVHKNYNNIFDILRNFWGLASFMWKRSFIEKIGLYDQNLNGCEDYEYLLRTYMNTDSILYKKEITMKYFLTQDSGFFKKYQDIINLKNDITKIYEIIAKIHNQIDIFIYYSNIIPDSNILNLINTTYTDNKFTKILISSQNDISFNDQIIKIPYIYKNIILNLCKKKNNHIFFENNALKSEISLPYKLVTKLSEQPNNVHTEKINKVIKSRNNNVGTKKVTIVMAYHNRKPQTIATLDSIQKTTYSNFNVIIVDDASTEENRLEDIIYRYSYPIKLIRINPENKTWINPCVAYNVGLLQADGDIIIIQNPEIFHVGDIISHAVNNLTVDQYFVYSCYASPDFKYNTELQNIFVNSKSHEIRDNVMNNFISKINYADFSFDWKYYVSKYEDLKNIKLENEAIQHWNSIGNKEGRQCNKHNIYSPNEYILWKGWYNHPKYNYRPLHFISATFKQNIDKLKGFNELYKDGLWYDDDDFLKRIELITTVNVIPETNVFGIHQYHAGGSVSHIKDPALHAKLVAGNKKVYEELLNNIKNKKIDINASLNNNFSKNIKKYVFVNKNIDNVMIGIGVTTYSDENTSDKRIQIINDSLNSLKRNMGNVIVIIVVDGKCTAKHKAILDKYSDVFEIIYRPKNGGIAKAKNTCIKNLLNKNIDIGFLADDDILYDKGWQQLYVSNIQNTGLQHMCYWPMNISPNVKYIDYNNTVIVNPQCGISGCFITFTRSVIDQIGYFRVYPYVYGYEHEDFTFRCVNKKIINHVTDVYGSNKYIKLHPNSLENKSLKIDPEKIELNKKHNKQQTYRDYVDIIE